VEEECFESCLMPSPETGLGGRRRRTGMKKLS